MSEFGVNIILSTNLQHCLEELVLVLENKETCWPVNPKEE